MQEDARKSKLARASAIVLTTADRLEGFRVTETLEVISAECAFGLDLFGDFFASLTDLFGGRSATTQTALRDARKKCLAELRAEAALIDADAVIAVDLDYSEFSGAGKSMLFMVASGTAVKIVPTSPRAAPAGSSGG
ncbi:MAG: YbjQ family protein [Longimicrobiales bacterium]